MGKKKLRRSTYGHKRGFTHDPRGDFFLVLSLRKNEEDLFVGRSSTAVSTATPSAGAASTAAAPVLEASRSLLRLGVVCTRRSKRGKKQNKQRQRWLGEADDKAKKREGLPTAAIGQVSGADGTVLCAKVFRAPTTASALEVGAAVEVAIAALTEGEVTTLGTTAVDVLGRGSTAEAFFPLPALGMRGSQSAFFKAPFTASSTGRMNLAEIHSSYQTLPSSSYVLRRNQGVRPRHAAG
ncbi:unnamed protein product [Prunus armeniaca]